MSDGDLFRHCEGLAVSFCAMKYDLTGLVVLVLLSMASLTAAQTEKPSGIKAEYLDDFSVTCKHLDQLSQATPADKYSWRPGAGVRSVSEVYVHIAKGNFLLLSLTGVRLPRLGTKRSSSANRS